MAIKDKVIIIMGASSGIGEATAKLLAKEGAKLVLAARREEKLKDIAASLPNAQIVYKKADVSNYDDVQQVVDLAISQVW